MATATLSPVLPRRESLSFSPPPHERAYLADPSTYYDAGNHASTSTAHHKSPRGRFVLGTRNSKLAMVQTIAVKASIEKRWPNLDVEIVGMTTAGDNNQSQPLYLLGGKALWTKELEVELLEGRVDAIVHCLKDIPTDFPPGCELGAILEREDPSDAFVVKKGLPYKRLDELPEGSVIGTSSVRRVAQLRKNFPHLKFADVRGNVQTRLRKLDDPELPYSALILASAGLIRLGLHDRLTSAVRPPVLYHAVGQGALAIEMRADDPHCAAIVGSLEHWGTGWTCRAERAMLNMLEGGCSVPVGAFSTLVEDIDITRCPIVGTNGVVPPPTVPIDAGSRPSGISNGLPVGHPSPPSHPNDPHSATLTLTGTITSLAGTSSVIATRTRLVHSIAEAEALGAEVAKELIMNGGKAILEELGRHVKEVGGEEDLDGKEIPFESGKSTYTAPAGAKSERVTYSSESTASAATAKGQKPSVFGGSGECQRPAGW